MTLIDNETYSICDSAVTTLGRISQINKAKEELSELHLELDRLQSSPIKTSDKNIITEIADVAIVTQQLAIMFGVDEVAKEIKNKADYLSMLVDTHLEIKSKRR